MARLKPYCSVVIPTYNEKENILLLIPFLLQIADKNRIPLEIIFVDDNSPDKTGKVAQKIFAKDKRVRVFIRQNQRELGTAILYGIFRARGQVVVGMDADFNHDPQKLPVLLARLKNYNLSVASRLAGGGGMGHRLRYYPTLIFNLFLKYLLGFPTMDNMSGYYAIRKAELFAFPLEEMYRGYGEYHIRLVYLAKKMGLKICEVGYYSPVRPFGESKSDLLYMFFKYLSVAFKLVLFDEV